MVRQVLDPATADAFLEGSSSVSAATEVLRGEEQDVEFHRMCDEFFLPFDHEEQARLRAAAYKKAKRTYPVCPPRRTSGQSHPSSA
jgi:hypothetical protein